MTWSPSRRAPRQWVEIALAVGAVAVSVWLVWAWLRMPSPPVPGVVTAVRTFYQVELVVLAGLVLLSLFVASRSGPPRFDSLFICLGAQGAMALLGILTIGPLLAMALAMGTLAGVSAARRTGAQIGRLLFLASFGFLLQGALMVGIIVLISLGAS